MVEVEGLMGSKRKADKEWGGQCGGKMWIWVD